ncbi:uncharacterized protein LOC124172107 [Ischnura elegans]|uniref:uncharacterized protein LOC124172107 n=1 Tax=Ischnura elegans TaxID=197161 RepID=UPI001ED87387|nr:uncharacterized protein LOC124172107 [Ischnura elegans]
MSVTTVPFSDYSGRNSEGTPCRLCMKKNDNYYYNIFTSNLASTMTVEYAIHELVGLRVAVDDGLPSALCPLCMEKLIEFSDFKKICLESDAELRKFSSRNYSRSIQGEGDGELGSSAVTKDCIPDAIMGPSRLACSVQTEIYIPLPECQTSRANMLVSSILSELGSLFGGANFSVVRPKWIGAHIFQLHDFHLYNRNH